MSDIVQRLRDSATQARALDRSELLNEAADEIVRLRITEAERETVLWCIFQESTPSSIARTLRSFLERIK